MKKLKEYWSFIILGILILVDVLTLLLFGVKDHDVQFWVGMSFLQLPFLGYSLVTYFFKNTIDSKVSGVVFLTYLIAMVLLSLVSFLTPFLKQTFIVLLISDIIITFLVFDIVIFELFKEKILKNK